MSMDIGKDTAAAETLAGAFPAHTSKTITQCVVLDVYIEKNPANVLGGRAIHIHTTHILPALVCMTHKHITQDITTLLVHNHSWFNLYCIGTVHSVHAEQYVDMAADNLT